MIGKDRRETGNWDKIFILLLVFGMFCFAIYLGFEGAREREKLALAIEDLHHNHCIDCPGHLHDASHYEGVEHQKALDHEKLHKLINKKLEIEKDMDYAHP